MKHLELTLNVITMDPNFVHIVHPWMEACHSLEKLKIKLPAWRWTRHKKREASNTYSRLLQKKLSPKLEVEIIGYLGSPDEVELASYIINNAASLQELTVVTALDSRWKGYHIEFDRCLVCHRHIGPKSAADDAGATRRNFTRLRFTGYRRIRKSSNHMLATVLLFSATFNEDVKAFASKIVKEIFVNDYDSIHGALIQEDRDKIIREFRDGLTQVLIQINLVINYDLPLRYENRSELDYEVYLHRAGRAGRFGRKGAVFNLLCHDSDYMIMNKIEKYFNSQITEDSLSSSEAFVCMNAGGSMEQRERIQVCSIQCWAVVR
ncbi:P-loop containing nucleoside triphosphate hydrolases superfamily protein [Perilla frutescens var. frutescens]|nr:P-loop containing nucleoside triphosphate hydrolases superfamily protein [Perilla frutescens var. frutescens]